MCWKAPRKSQSSCSYRELSKALLAGLPRWLAKTCCLGHVKMTKHAKISSPQLRWQKVWVSPWGLSSASFYFRAKAFCSWGSAASSIRSFRGSRFATWKRTKVTQPEATGWKQLLKSTIWIRLPTCVSSKFHESL